MDYEFTENRAGKDEVYEHLVKCNRSFIPALNSRVDIKLYTEKIMNGAVRFEAWFNDRLIGLVAVYLNDNTRKVAYVTNVSVEPVHTGKGLAKKLVMRSIKRASQMSFEQLQLEVSVNNQPAVNLYKDLGFKKIEDTTDESYKLALKLN
ncbi:MAG: GNAT family N-acetyltransferase [Flammeovirgaceae bacterium]|nr:MAG: GNAT family N-acetyltransferase [Flammeovirgaceae bacterium]